MSDARFWLVARVSMGVAISGTPKRFGSPNAFMCHRDTTPLVAPAQYNFRGSRSAGAPEK